MRIYFLVRDQEVEVQILSPRPLLQKIELLFPVFGSSAPKAPVFPSLPRSVL